MRAHEFITEDAEEATGSGSGQSANGGKLHKHHAAVIPGLKTTPGLTSHYYDMYRLGVHMARSPDEQEMDPRSAVANQMAVLAYSPADAEIIAKSAKDLGIDLKSLTDHSSSEAEDTHKVSPHHNPGPIKRKNK